MILILLFLPSCTLPSLILLLKSFPHHRDLLSFPTRRSSDLNSYAPPTKTSPTNTTPKFMVKPPPVPHQCRYHTRSEEHTSELQSRGHLVCRLLLEKKKQEM